MSRHPDQRDNVTVFRRELIKRAQELAHGQPSVMFGLRDKSCRIKAIRIGYFALLLAYPGIKCVAQDCEQPCAQVAAW